MFRTPFFGGYGVGRSTNLEDSQLINLYPEIVEGKDGKAVGAFYMTPGLDLFAALDAVGPVRGLNENEPMGLMTAVSGANVYQVTRTGAATLLGTIGTNGPLPVSIINNGVQTAIFDGMAGYLVDAIGLQAIALPFSGPVIASYQDGFGVVYEKNTQIWWQSALNDLATWGALNFSSADATPTNIVSIIELHREEWLLKSDSIEVWVNGGGTGFVFQRLEGVFIELGCAAAFSPAIIGNSVIWLSSNDQGSGQVVMAFGYNPKRVSTHAIERQIASWPRIDDAIGISYQQEGHNFYMLTSPSGNQTLVYDATASEQAGQQIWHQRAAFLNGQFDRHWANCYAFFAGKHLVGDYLTGNVYSFNLDKETDNGSRRKWLRTWRALPKAADKTTTYPGLRIDMQTGIGVPDGTSPLVMLRWSDDGGHNWSNYRTAKAGETGQTAKRVTFRRLGSTRMNTGLDRIFELSSSDAFGVAIIGAVIGE